MKLKYTEVKTVRQQYLQKQHQRCALCDELIEDDAVLDHCHKTGRIRAVLHRGCNALLGKIENNLPRNRVTMSRLENISKNLIGYLKQEYEDVVHPTHKTAEERKELVKKRARARRKKHAST